MGSNINVPSVLLLKDALKKDGRRSKKFREVVGSAVYFLMEKGNIIYIGKSLNGRLSVRLRRHFCEEDKRERVDQRWVILFDNTCDCDMYEVYLIGKFNPEMNNYNYEKPSRIKLPDVYPELYYTKGDNFFHGSTEHKEDLLNLNNITRNIYNIKENKPKTRVKPLVKKEVIIKEVEVIREVVKEVIEVPHEGDRLSGCVYGNLTIRGTYREYGETKQKVIAVCTCGKVRNYNLSALLNGRVTSCGTKKCKV